MKRVRQIVRLLAIAGLTLLIMPALLLGAVCGDRTTRLRGQVLRFWCRGVARILRMAVHVRGQAPAAPFYLVSNHLSYLDIVTLGTCLPAVFVAKSEVASWPVMGTLSRWANTIFVDRGRRRDLLSVNQRVARLMHLAYGIVVFPEGTSTAGEGVLPFRAGLLEPAVLSGRAVSHACLGYRTPAGAPPAHLAICWWGDMTFGRHLLDLLGLKSLEATIHFGASPLHDSDRRRLALRLHAAIVKDFEPVIPSGLPRDTTLSTPSPDSSSRPPTDSTCTASET